MTLKNSILLKKAKRLRQKEKKQKRWDDKNKCFVNEVNNLYNRIQKVLKQAIGLDVEIEIWEDGGPNTKKCGKIKIKSSMNDNPFAGHCVELYIPDIDSNENINIVKCDMKYTSYTPYNDGGYQTNDTTYNLYFHAEINKQIVCYRMDGPKYCLEIENFEDRLSTWLSHMVKD